MTSSYQWQTLASWIILNVAVRTGQSTDTAAFRSMQASTRRASVVGENSRLLTDAFTRRLTLWVWQAVARRASVIIQHSAVNTEVRAYISRAAWFRQAVAGRASVVVHHSSLRAGVSAFKMAFRFRQTLAGRAPLLVQYSPMKAAVVAHRSAVRVGLALADLTAIEV